MLSLSSTRFKISKDIEFILVKEAFSYVGCRNKFGMTKEDESKISLF